MPQRSDLFAPWARASSTRRTLASILRRADRAQPPRAGQRRVLDLARTLIFRFTGNSLEKSVRSRPGSEPGDLEETEFEPSTRKAMACSICETAVDLRRAEFRGRYQTGPIHASERDCQVRHERSHFRRNQPFASRKESRRILRCRPRRVDKCQYLLEKSAANFNPLDMPLVRLARRDLSSVPLQSREVSPRRSTSKVECALSQSPRFDNPLRAHADVAVRSTVGLKSSNR
jgi:hypothetical protein